MPQMNGYIGRAPGDSAVTKATQIYNVTSPTSTFTFNSGYEVGYFDLYLNGVRLVVNSDYTAGNGTTFILSTPATNGDVVEAIAYKAFNLGNVSSAPGSFSIGDDLAVSGNISAGGSVTATNGFFGDGTNITNLGDSGYAKTAGIATVAQGLTGVPEITVSTITGVAATFTGAVSIGGTLTYEDVTNVDSVGVITASGVNVSGANLKVGSGVTISPNGNPIFTGIVTSTDTFKALLFIADQSSSSSQIWNGLQDGTRTSFIRAGGEAAFLGNVGIGTDNPIQKLHLASSGSGNVSLNITNDTTGHSAGNGTELSLGADEQVQIWNYENTFFRIGTNNAERLRIGSAGTVTVYNGNSNTGKTLGQEAFRVGNGGGNFRFSVYPDGSTVIGGTGDINNNSILLQNDGRASFSGVLGVGTTGQNWRTASFPGVIQVGQGSLVGQDIDDGATQIQNNAFFDQTNNRWEYIRDDAAEQISFITGNTIFNRAVVGTADAAITWNESARISVGGSFGIGTNDPQCLLHLEGDKTTATKAKIILADNQSGNGDFFFESGGAGSQNEFRMGEGSEIMITVVGDVSGGGTGTRGYVGINSTTPERRLDVLETASQTVAQFQTNGQTKAFARFECHGDNPVFVGASRSDFNIEMGGANMLTIDHSTNDIDIAGSLKVSSGEGIDFSATANSSGTMTSELLDDYEEGTWTPTQDAGNPAISNIGSMSGNYTKIGNQVTVLMIISQTSNNMGFTAGNYRFDGLPFTPTTSFTVSSTIANSTNTLTNILGQVLSNDQVFLTFPSITSQRFFSMTATYFTSD